jgi:large subunit ribosomal protein L25
VVYSKGVAPLKLSLDPVVLDRKIRASHAGINTLFDLEGEGQLNGRTVMVKELQRDPVKGTVLHADFHEIDLTQLLNVTVPIQLLGTAPGVSMGGLIEHTLREIELACMPGSIPDEILADIAALDVGDSLHVSDLPLPEGVELVTSEALSVVSVVLPRAAAAEADAEAAEGAEGEEAASGDASSEAGSEGA